VKNLGEAFLRAYHKEYKLEYTVFRFFNTYGPLQSEDFVITRFLNSSLKNENITIYGDGSQTRTFCYINDNVDVCEKIFRQNLHINDVVNIGSDVEVSILTLAEKIISLTGSKSKVVHLPPLAEGDMTRRKPDISKMNALLIRPITTLEEGLKQIISHRRIN
jgi:UDP-glucose 4-epimerase